MPTIRGPRLQVGSTPWIAEERSSALQIVQSEVEEFSFSARNEMEWLNEHMAGIFDENETKFADVFKTPGKLRGKTPRTVRKPVVLGDTRVPLSDVFTTTPNGAPPQQLSKLLSPKQIGRSSKPLVAIAKPMPQSQSTQDSGYYGSQDIDIAPASIYKDLESNSQKLHAVHHMTISTKQSPSQIPFTDVSDKTFQPAKEEQTRQTTKQAVFSDAESSPMRHNIAKPLQSSSPLKYVPLKSPILHSDFTDIADANEAGPESPSDASSPIRQVVRKSSLNFASLPAREPLAAGKSVGRVSRVSHLEKPIAVKNLDHTARATATDDENYSDMDVDDEEVPLKSTTGEAARNSKTYTQRLQDQINQLGKSNSASMPQTRSYATIPAIKQNTMPVSNSDPSLTISPARKHSISKVLQTTPGAFPEDEDDDDWIEPPSAAPLTEARPALPKSHSADVMQGIQGKSTIGQPEFVDQIGEHAIRLQTHGKSASVSTLPSMKVDSSGDLTLVKTASVSNGLSTVVESQSLETPYGSPSRLFRDSPLKQMKSKLSSILKGSRSLLASSAAISAEGKSSLLTPSTAYLGIHPSPSSTSLAPKTRIASDASLKTVASASPPKTRRTRASAEREREDKRREKEAKLMAEQMDRLDKAREREREKARVFSKEQERIAAMEREIVVKKQEEQMHAKQTPKVARVSPRKMRSDDEARSEDVEMTDEIQVAPPSAARATSTTHSLRNRDVKRPVKPTKEDGKAKQAPTVIRVKPGSQHSQLHQAGRPSANPQDHASNSGSQPQLSTKASKASLHSKASTQSLKSSTSTRPKAPDAATKKKEAEEREAQKRRDAKAENERKRAASQEEQRRLEQQRRADAERLKKERDLSEERKTAQRQAVLEKAKQTKAPPPAARSQPTGPPDFTICQQPASQKTENQGNRPPSRMMTGPQRQPTESNPGKAGTKRPVGPDSSQEAQDRRPPTRAGTAYQAKDAKRRRTSEVLQAEPEAVNQHIKGPPVRPSPGFKKDMPPKSLFQNGYSNVPPSATHDLFKASVTSQQLQSKAVRPVDMAQISKGNIPFAPNGAGSTFKTPARPAPFLGAKSAVKSVSRPSPQFQNGEAIDLPEIQTDDEDEEEDTGMNNIAGWAASPDLRAALMRQETMDPSQIFGPPAPLNMEEVFSKSKDRWHKFRARTSSANWSGPDGLTEDDIRKDMAAREKLRREGGWSYEMSKDVL